MTQQNILKAAERQFCHFGFSKVTMKDIASEVGMGKASLYYYFPTKEELFRAVIVTKHDAFMQDLQRRVEKDGPVAERVRTYIAMRIDYFAEITNLNIVDFQNWHTLRPLMREAYTTFAEQEHGFLRAILGEGIRSGELRLRNAGKTASAIIQVMQGLRCHFLRTIERPYIEAAQYRSLKVQMLSVTDLLLNGMLTPRSGRRTKSRQHH